MKQSLTVQLPEKVSTNVFYNKHYHDRSRVQHDFHAFVKSAVREFKTKVVEEYPVKLSFRFLLQGRLLDVSNLSAMAKILEDGLVRCKILKDDSPKYINAIYKEVEKNTIDCNVAEITIETN